jgi:NADPH:quinone reductase
MLRWIGEGKLRAPATTNYPLEKAAEAMNALLERKSTGKLVITTGK